MEIRRLFIKSKILVLKIQKDIKKENIKNRYVFKNVILNQCYLIYWL